MMRAAPVHGIRAAKPGKIVDGEKQNTDTMTSATPVNEAAFLQIAAFTWGKEFSEIKVPNSSSQARLCSK